MNLLKPREDATLSDGIKDIFSMIGACILKYLYIEDKEDAPIFRFCSFTIKDVWVLHREDLMHV